MSLSATAIILALLLSISHSATDSSDYDYGFVIDAGSTGSRIYAYRWKERTSTDTSITPESRPKQYGNRMKAGPISDIASLVDAEKLLIPLIQHVKNLTYSEQSRWNEFPIYLKATAG
eukprot:802624_1